MAKILNLDKLSQGSGRELTIGGVAYPIQAMTVENFIETSRKVDQITKDGASIADQIEATVAMICRSVPMLQADVLMKYELTVLNEIASFVRGDDVEGQEEVEAGK